MALVTSVVHPEQRGRFLSFNSAVQQASAGIGTSIAGIIVTIGADGRVHHYSW